MQLSVALHQKSKLEYESDKIYKWLCDQKESNIPKNDALLATIEGIDLKDCD